MESGRLRPAGPGLQQANVSGGGASRRLGIEVDVKSHGFKAPARLRAARSRHIPLIPPRSRPRY